MARTQIAVLACALVFLAGQAAAADGRASLGEVKGDVLVASAGGVSAGKPGSSLKPGDRVIARTGAAQVRYADGCVRTLPAGGMATIADKSPCAGGPGLVQAADASSAQFFKLPAQPGAYVAGAGVLVIAGALLYGAFGISD